MNYLTYVYFTQEREFVLSWGWIRKTSHRRIRNYKVHIQKTFKCEILLASLSAKRFDIDVNMNKQIDSGEIMNWTHLTESLTHSKLFTVHPSAPGTFSKKKLLPIIQSISKRLRWIRRWNTFLKRMLCPEKRKVWSRFACSYTICFRMSLFK